MMSELGWSVLGLEGWSEGRKEGMYFAGVVRVGMDGWMDGWMDVRRGLD
jgi:hypothetical protein